MISEAVITSSSFGVKPNHDRVVSACHPMTVVIMAARSRSPAASPCGATSSIRARSSGVSRISAAAKPSSGDARCLIPPGIWAEGFTPAWSGGHGVAAPAAGPSWAAGPEARGRGRDGRWIHRRGRRPRRRGRDGRWIRRRGRRPRRRGRDGRWIRRRGRRPRRRGRDERWIRRVPGLERRGRRSRRRLRRRPAGRPEPCSRVVRGIARQGGRRPGRQPFEPRLELRLAGLEPIPDQRPEDARNVGAEPTLHTQAEQDIAVGIDLERAEPAGRQSHDHVLVVEADAGAGDLAERIGAAGGRAGRGGGLADGQGDLRQGREPDVQAADPRADGGDLGEGFSVGRGGPRLLLHHDPAGSSRSQGLGRSMPSLRLPYQDRARSAMRDQVVAVACVAIRASPLGPGRTRAVPMMPWIAAAIDARLERTRVSPGLWRPRPR